MDDNNLPAIDQLPSNVMAEAAFLGGCMLNNQLAEECSWLSCDAFYEPFHGRIWSAILREVTAGRLANPITLKPLFEQDAHGIELGTGYLGELTGSGAAIIGARSFANQISDLHQRREIAIALKQAYEAAIAPFDDTSPAKLVQAADEIINRAMLTAQPHTNDVPSLGTVLQGVADHHDQVQSGAIAPAWTVDDLPEIDEALGGGANAGDLIVLAGRPGMGKTGVVLGIATAFARAGHGVAFFSLEMSKEQLGQRLITDMCYDGRQDDFTYYAFKKGRLSPPQRRHAEEMIASAKAMPMYVDDRAEVTAADIIGRIRRLQRRFSARGTELRIVVIDYLQLIQAGRTYSGQKVNEISEITRSLKIAAKSLGISIILLSQLSRAVEQRDNKRPMMSDLRDSGSIEQDADCVLFCYREEYYLQASEPQKDSTDAKKIAAYNAWRTDIDTCRDKLELISSKVRGGATGKQHLLFLTSYQAVRSGSFWSGRL